MPCFEGLDLKSHSVGLKSIETSYKFRRLPKNYLIARIKERIIGMVIA